MQPSFLNSKKKLIIAGAVTGAVLLVVILLLLFMRKPDGSPYVDVGQDKVIPRGGGLRGGGGGSYTPKTPKDDVVQFPGGNDSSSEYELPNSEYRKTMAKGILNWAHNLRTKNGAYSYGVYCKSSSSCDSQQADNRAGVALLWARYKYFEASHDASELSIIDQDLKTYTDRSKVSVIQNDFWNCRMMYDLWKSPLLTPEQRALAGEICLRGGYSVKDFKEFYTRGKKASLSDAEIKSFVEGKQLVADYPIVEQMLPSYSAYVSDLIAKNRIKANDEYLQLATFYMRRALQTYSQQAKHQDYVAALLMVAAHDMYIQTKNPMYNELFQYFYKKVTTPMQCQETRTCGLIAQACGELALLTKKSEYRDCYNYHLSQLGISVYDMKSFPGYLLGNGAFRSMSAGGFFYNMTENAVITEALTQFIK